MMDNVILIDNVSISEKVLTYKFACDYLACKGACCYFPDTKGYDGCEVNAEETRDIQDNIERLRPHIEDDCKEAAEIPVYSYENSPNDRFVSFNDAGKCIFCSFKDKSCIFKSQDVGLEMPIHCEMYPVKEYWKNGRVYLDILDEHGDVCEPARVKARRENIHAVKFVKSALVRRFGQKFYDKLEAQLR